MSRADTAAASLLDRHDALLVDLDGVVHLGDHPVPPAVPALAAVRAAGKRVVFVTNNASRTAAQVAASLTQLGVDAIADEVLTSSMAAADLLAEALPAGAKVLVVGGRGLAEPIASAGLQPVERAEDEPAAVVQGWSPDLTWALLAEGAVAIRRGARWVATNADRTLPSPRGPLPGNGAMLAAVAFAVGNEPEVVGKPAPTLFTTAVERIGAKAPLVVGDRLDTDIAGAVAAGLPSLLVLTGVSRPRDLVVAPPQIRPTYVGRDLGAVTTPQVALTETGEVGDGLDGLRRVCRRAWSGELAPDDYDDAVARLALD